MKKLFSTSGVTNHKKCKTETNVRTLPRFNNPKNKFRNYLEILEIFTVREIKKKYQPSLLGPIWLILQPLLTAMILNLVFGKLVRINTGTIPYFIFMFSGYIYWNYFQQSILNTKEIFLWNRALVTKNVFPREILPLSLILSRLPDFITYQMLLIFFYSLSGYSIGLHNLAVLFLIIPLILLIIGIVLITSAANAFYRDFGKILEIVLMVLFYATPIIYPETILPSNLKFLLINPVALIILFAREALFKNSLRFDYYLVATGISFIIFLTGIYFFLKIEKLLTDKI